MTDGLLDTIGRAIEDALAERLPGVVDRLAVIGGPRAYSVPEVADRLGLSENTVRNLIRDGHLPAVPHLPKLRVAAAALDEFLAGKP